MFGDVWRPLLLAVCVATALAFVGLAFPDLSRYGIFRLMSGEVYFRGGGLPWLGLLASTALSIAILSVASRNLARQDF